MSNYKNQVEAILFASGRLMEIDTLINLTGASSKKVISNAVEKLMEEYEKRDSPMMVVEEKGGWKLTVREKYLSLVRNIVSDMELPKSVLETLAVIAWKSPVMQSEIISIRHNKAYEHIKELVELEFISKESYGRSYMIKLTNKFFNYFDIEGKKDIKEIFKTIQETPVQRKVDEFEGLDVYESQNKEKENLENDGEHIGKLEIYESSEGEFSNEEPKKDLVEDEIRSLEGEFSDEPQEKTDENSNEEKAKEIIKEFDTKDFDESLNKISENIENVGPIQDKKEEDVIEEIEKINENLDEEFKKVDLEKINDKNSEKEVFVENENKSNQDDLSDDLPKGLESETHDEDVANDLYDKAKKELNDDSEEKEEEIKKEFTEEI